MHIRKILPTELTWANAQYTSINFVQSLASDLIVVAEIDGVKAGLGRITQVDNDAGELGGIFVLPEFRGRSIATGIVEFLLQHSDYPNLFCVPFTHLAMFYQRFGFLPVVLPAASTVAIPQKIVDKNNFCARTYETPTVLLYRSQKITHDTN